MNTLRLPDKPVGGIWRILSGIRWAGAPQGTVPPPSFFSVKLPVLSPAEILITLQLWDVPEQDRRTPVWHRGQEWCMRSGSGTEWAAVSLTGLETQQWCCFQRKRRRENQVLHIYSEVFRVFCCGLVTAAGPAGAPGGSGSVGSDLQPLLIGLSQDKPSRRRASSSTVFLRSTVTLTADPSCSQLQPPPTVWRIWRRLTLLFPLGER